MECPECNGHTKVQHTITSKTARPGHHGEHVLPYSVRRRRKCVTCKHTFRTVEIIDDRILKALEYMGVRINDK